jgi:hypothetical protein
MAFLDNTGDIILDAVLTDTGRKRMAQGDGSFRIVKFALGDDEIDYSLYRNSNNTAGRHPSGSAYYDLSILQSPILEAFTNNTSIMKSKLVTYARNDLLYLPVIKLNDGSTNMTTAKNGAKNTNSWWDSFFKISGYVLTADSTTTDLVDDMADSADKAGIRKGFIDAARGVGTESPIIFEQGLDSTDLSVANLVQGDLRRETQYILEVDNRFLKILPGNGNGNDPISPAFIDDDNIASYFVSFNSDAAGFFGTAPGQAIPSFQLGNGGTADTNSVLGSVNSNTGRYGLRFGFKLMSAESLQLGTRMFTEFGGTTTKDFYQASDGNTYRFIDTSVRVTGYTTGYSVDLPIKIIKKV